MRGEWKITALGDSLRLIRNGISCKQSKKGPGSKVTRIQTIAALKVDSDKVGYADLSEAEQRSFRLEIGDILFSHINSPSHVGKTALVDEDYGLIHGMNLLCFRAAREIDPRFLDYYLKNLYWSGFWIKRCKQSVNQASVNQQDIKKVPFSYPSLPEQKRIVAILDEAFAGIATAVSNAEKNLANARELFESYLKSVFSQQGEAWQRRKLSEVCVNLDSRRVPITKSKRKPGQIPYYGASGVVDHVADYIFDEDLLLVSEDGANLLARTYPIAFSISGKSWVNNHAHVLRFAATESQRFIEYYLNSISLEPYVSGMAQPKLNQKALNSIKVPFPPVDQQRLSVDKLDEIAGGKNQLSEIYRQKLISLTELRQSLLQKAFSGELTAVPQDEIETALA